MLPQSNSANGNKIQISLSFIKPWFCLVERKPHQAPHALLAATPNKKKKWTFTKGIQFWGASDPVIVRSTFATASRLQTPLSLLPLTPIIIWNANKWHDCCIIHHHSIGIIVKTPQCRNTTLFHSPLVQLSQQTLQSCCPMRSSAHSYDCWAKRSVWSFLSRLLAPIFSFEYELQGKKNASGTFLHRSLEIFLSI